MVTHRLIAPHTIPCIAPHSTPHHTPHTIPCIAPYTIPCIAPHSTPHHTPHTIPCIAPHTIPSHVTKEVFLWSHNTRTFCMCSTFQHNAVFVSWKPPNTCYWRILVATHRCTSCYQQCRPVLRCYCNWPTLKMHNTLLPRCCMWEFNDIHTHFTLHPSPTYYW